MAITIGQVIDALKKTVDPEIGLNIIDLGLLYNLKIENIAIPKIANPYIERNSEALCIFIRYQLHAYVE